MATVDPYVVRIPQQLVDPKTGTMTADAMAFFQYLNRWNHDMWLRSGGGTDAIDGVTELGDDNQIQIAITQSNITQIKEEIDDIVSDIPPNFSSKFSDIETALCDLQSDVVPRLNRGVELKINDLQREDTGVDRLSALVKSLFNRIEDLEAQL